MTDSATSQPTLSEIARLLESAGYDAGPDLNLQVALLCLLDSIRQRNGSSDAAEHGTAEDSMEVENTSMPSSASGDVMLPRVIEEPMFIAPEVLRSISVHDFTDDPLMADLSERFVFWQEHTRVSRFGYNIEIIPDIVLAAVKRILAKYPDTDVGILPQFDLRSELDGDRCSECERAAIESGAITEEQPEVATMPKTVGRVRFALVHYRCDESLIIHRKHLCTRDGAIHGMKSQRVSCCIVMEAEEHRKHSLSDLRPDVIAAASALMSRTSLTEVRTCITNGKYWMFGCLKKQDGRRVYLDFDELPLETPGLYSTGPDGILCGQLSKVVGLLACWIDGVAPFVGT